MTSKNDEKDVKSNPTSGQKAKSYYIELFKSLDDHLTSTKDLKDKTNNLCEAWIHVHTLCQHSAPPTQAHLVSWIQKHTANTILRDDWQSPKSKDEHENLKVHLSSFIEITEELIAKKDGKSHSWEEQLVQRAKWFSSALENPWAHPTLKAILDPNGNDLSDNNVLEWLKEERGIVFVTRLRQLSASKCDDLALALATAVMDRVRTQTEVASDVDQCAASKDQAVPNMGFADGSFPDILEKEAGFSKDVWEIMTDIEFVLLNKMQNGTRCIELAKQTPLRTAYQLVERLRSRLTMAPHEKRLWKNANDVATLIAQVVIARCMVVPVCAGWCRSVLSCMMRALGRLLPPSRLPAATAALAAPARTAAHLHTLADAVNKQCKDEMKPFVCELYIRAITAGMNELESLKIKKVKEQEARSHEKMLATWFTQLGQLLSVSKRIRCECTLTAFSVHPSQDMYKDIEEAPDLPPVAVEKEEKEENTDKESSDFGSWANDSHANTVFVKTSETLNLKQQQQTNVLSTALLNEGEALGLSAELCQDLALLLSGPRLKTLTWDMDRTLLLESCRTYMERTHGGTKALTTELKYLNLDPQQYQHLRDEEEGEDDIYYGIEKGYEHLVELPEPEQIWQDAATDSERASLNSDFELEITRKKISKYSSDEDSDPLKNVSHHKFKEKKKERPLSKERSKKKSKSPSIERSVSQEVQKEENKAEKKERRNKMKSTDSKSLSSLLGVKIPVCINNDARKLKKPPFTKSLYDHQEKSSLLSTKSKTFSDAHEASKNTSGSLKIQQQLEFQNNQTILNAHLLNLIDKKKETNLKPANVSSDQSQNVRQTLTHPDAKIVNQKVADLITFRRSAAAGNLSCKDVGYQKDASKLLGAKVERVPGSCNSTDIKRNPNSLIKPIKPDTSSIRQYFSEFRPHSMNSKPPANSNNNVSKVAKHQDAFKQFLLGLQNNMGNHSLSVKPVKQRSKQKILPNNEIKKDQINSSAKQSKSVENVPNTYLRRNHMHKNKEVNLSSSSVIKNKNVSEIQSKVAELQERGVMLYNHSSNSSIKLDPCNYQKAPNKVMVERIDHVPLNALTKITSNKNPTLSHILNQPTINDSTVYIQPPASGHSRLSEKDQNDILLLLQQQSRLKEPVHSYFSKPTATFIPSVKNTVPVLSNAEQSRISMITDVKTNSNSSAGLCRGENYNTKNDQSYRLTNVRAFNNDNKVAIGAMLNNQCNLTNQTGVINKDNSSRTLPIANLVGFKQRCKTDSTNAQLKTYSSHVNTKPTKGDNNGSMLNNMGGKVNAVNMKREMSQVLDSLTAALKMNPANQRSSVIKDDTSNNLDNKESFLPQNVLYQGNNNNINSTFNEKYSKINSSSENHLQKSNNELMSNSLLRTSHGDILKKLSHSLNIKHNQTSYGLNQTPYAQIQSPKAKIPKTHMQAPDTQRELESKKLYTHPINKPLPTTNSIKSDYDEFADLFDNDLLKEIGELSSDEDSCSLATSKGKSVSTISTKPFSRSKQTKRMNVDKRGDSHGFNKSKSKLTDARNAKGIEPVGKFSPNLEQKTQFHRLESPVSCLGHLNNNNKFTTTLEYNNRETKNHSKLLSADIPKSVVNVGVQERCPGIRSDNALDVSYNQKTTNLSEAKQNKPIILQDVLIKKADIGCKTSLQVNTSVTPKVVKPDLLLISNPSQFKIKETSSSQNISEMKIIKDECNISKDKVKSELAKNQLSDVRDRLSNEIYSVDQHQDANSSKLQHIENEKLEAMTSIQSLKKVQNEFSVVGHETLNLQNLKQPGLKAEDINHMIKRSAIMNRIIHFYSDLKPIPLPFKPLSAYKKQHFELNEHKTLPKKDNIEKGLDSSGQKDKLDKNPSQNNNKRGSLEETKENSLHEPCEINSAKAHALQNAITKNDNPDNKILDTKSKGSDDEFKNNSKSLSMFDDVNDKIKEKDIACTESSVYGSEIKQTKRKRESNKKCKEIKTVKISKDDDNHIPKKEQKSGEGIEPIPTNPVFYRNKIRIQEMPRQSHQDPNKIYFTIRLPNGKMLKAAISGQMVVTADTLFDHPSLKAILLNTSETNKHYTMNIQQHSSSSGLDIKVNKVMLEPKPEPVTEHFPSLALDNNTHTNIKEQLITETVNLVSDEEEDNLHVCQTEFGNFNVRMQDEKLLSEHQKILSKKSFVKLERIDSEQEKRKNAKAKEISKMLLDALFEKPQTTLEENVIEIDDSSSDNDDVQLVNEIKLISEFKQDKEIHELKKDLLKDIGVVGLFTSQVKEEIKDDLSSNIKQHRSQKTDKFDDIEFALLKLDDNNEIYKNNIVDNLSQKVTETNIESLSTKQRRVSISILNLKIDDVVVNDRKSLDFRNAACASYSNMPCKSDWLKTKFDLHIEHIKYNSVQQDIKVLNDSDSTDCESDSDVTTCSLGSEMDTMANEVVSGQQITLKRKLFEGQGTPCKMQRLEDTNMLVDKPSVDGNINKKICTSDEPFLISKIDNSIDYAPCDIDICNDDGNRVNNSVSEKLNDTSDTGKLLNNGNQTTIFCERLQPQLESDIELGSKSISSTTLLIDTPKHEVLQPIPRLKEYLDSTKTEYQDSSEFMPPKNLNKAHVCLQKERDNVKDIQPVISFVRNIYAQDSEGKDVKSFIACDNNDSQTEKINSESDCAVIYASDIHKEDIQTCIENERRVHAAELFKADPQTCIHKDAIGDSVIQVASKIQSEEIQTNIESGKLLSENANANFLQSETSDNIKIKNNDKCPIDMIYENVIELNKKSLINVRKNDCRSDDNGDTLFESDKNIKNALNDIETDHKSQSSVDQNKYLLDDNGVIKFDRETNKGDLDAIVTSVEDNKNRNNAIDDTGINIEQKSQTSINENERLSDVTRGTQINPDIHKENKQAIVKFYVDDNESLTSIGKNKCPNIKSCDKQFGPDIYKEDEQTIVTTSVDENESNLDNNVYTQFDPEINKDEINAHASSNESNKNVNDAVKVENNSLKSAGNHYCTLDDNGNTQFDLVIHKEHIQASVTYSENYKNLKDAVIDFDNDSQTSVGKNKCISDDHRHTQLGPTIHKEVIQASMDNVNEMVAEIYHAKNDTCIGISKGPCTDLNDLLQSNLSRQDTTESFGENKMCRLDVIIDNVIDSDTKIQTSVPNDDINNKDNAVSGSTSNDTKADVRINIRDTCMSNDNCIRDNNNEEREISSNSYKLQEERLKTVEGYETVSSPTLLYKDGVLKGKTVEHPKIGTCFVFRKNDVLSRSHKETSVTFFQENYLPKKERISKTMYDLNDLNLNVTMPKVTYIKSRKRKIDLIEPHKYCNKKYRKGKNIDYPKFTAAAIADSAYRKEYNRVFDYCRSLKFSFSIPFGKEHIDVFEQFKDWPIQEKHNINIEDLDSDTRLFDDKENAHCVSSPTEQSFAEELSAEIINVPEPSSILETNFNMGFGERSGRVKKHSKRMDHSNFSAATLSDVKHQPFSHLSNDNKLCHNIHVDNHNQNVISYVKYLKIKEKVRSFFKNCAIELNQERKLECSECNQNFLLDLCSYKFFEPPPCEAIVQVVQVGQLPVSSAAQNPVTCDPRVTQVSHGSPSQFSAESSPRDDSQSASKSEYTELTTADIRLPTIQDYDKQDQSVIQNTFDSSVNIAGDKKTLDTKNTKRNHSTKVSKESNNLNNSNNDLKCNNSNNDMKCNNKEINSELGENHHSASFSSTVDNSTEFSQIKQNGGNEKTDQIAHAMNAAGISTVLEPTNNTRPQLSNNALVNILSQKIRQGVKNQPSANNNCSKSSLANTMSIQQALAQILPPPLNQTNTSENQPSLNSIGPQVLHIVQGKNHSNNQITLVENTQPSVISGTNATQVLHIVQNKSGVTANNGTSTPQQSSFAGLSLVDAGLQSGPNQLLHILNTGNQKSTNNPGLLKRVNFLTNLSNVQGSNEQKMVQFVCKSADGKSIQLNSAHQRGMVLRLQPIETPNTQVQTKTLDHNQELNPTCQNNQGVSKDSVTNQQEIKSRSVYEENYAKFIQKSSSTPATSEKSTSLPKFNQAFGKTLFQDGSEKPNDNVSNIVQTNSNTDNNDCHSTENPINLEQTGQANSPPLLIKSSTQTTQAQPHLIQQIKPTIAPMNIQTMHGGVIYTRQIPVNIGGGQTINLITVPSTELTEDATQKTHSDIKFLSQGDIEPSIIKIVPQNQSTTSTDTQLEDGGNHNNNSDSNQNQPSQPVLTQMRIKLPMLSKAHQMVAGTRVVRPSFFQIHRNVIGGGNQPVYQQLVLTAAPPLGQQSIRLQQQPNKQVKPSEGSAEPQMSSSTLEQLREFDMVLEQVKERSTVQPNVSMNTFKLNSSTDSTDSCSNISETNQHTVFSTGNHQAHNVTYASRKTIVTTSVTSTYVRSPDSTDVADSPTGVNTPMQHTPTSDSSSNDLQSKSAKISSKSKSKPKISNPPNTVKINTTVPQKTSLQKPLEDEQTTQRILYILAEYKEQVENSPDKDKPAPRRRSNPPSNPSGSSKRKKSSSGSRKSGRDLSPVHGDDTCRTMGSEDSSCGTSQGDCNESCLETNSPQDSPQKVARKLTFEQETANQQRPQAPRNVIVADGQTITVARGTAGKPATAVLMPTNYILPVSMVKGGQQIAIVTNRGPKLLTVSGGEGGTTNALLLQRLIGPAGLKPVLTRPGVRHVRLPAAALHNLQGFNLAAVANVQTPPDSTASPAPALTPDLVENRTASSPWTEKESQDAKPEQGNSPEASESWNIQSANEPQEYTYEETVRADNMDRTVLVVQKKEGQTQRHHRLTHVSAAALRHKYAILEHELRLQKSLSEECEDLGVDSPSASELFPEAELLFASSPAAHEHAHEQTPHSHSHTPQPQVINQSSIPQPDIDDQIATDHLINRQPTNEDRQDLDVNLGLGDVAEIPASLNQEEFARSHPNTTFHTEPTEGEVQQPFTITGLKGRHITSTIFHSNSAPATVLMTTSQPTVISQTASEVAPQTVNVMLPATHNSDVMSSVLVKDDGLTRFDNILTDSRELHRSNTASAIVHSASNATQVIRRVCYEDDKRDTRFLMDEPDAIIAGDDAKMIAEDSRDATLESMAEDVDDARSSPERHTELFWESNSASGLSENRRPLDFSSDSEKCCKSPSFDETNSTDSSGVGTHLRLDSVIKEARGRDRSGSVDGSSAEDAHPPLRTYPPKRMYHAEEERSLSGKTRAGERSPDSLEVRRRASNRGVVKRGCHCCNGSPTPSRPKKPRQRKPTTDFSSN